jgi:hypothetical protein
MLHNNAPAHKATTVCQFITPKNFAILYNPPYCPHVSPPDYFQFPQVENKVKRAPMCMCCWDPIGNNQWITESAKRGILAAFQKQYDYGKAHTYANQAYYE